MRAEVVIPAPSSLAQPAENSVSDRNWNTADGDDDSATTAQGRSFGVKMAAAMTLPRCNQTQFKTGSMLPDQNHSSADSPAEKVRARDGTLLHSELLGSNRWSSPATGTLESEYARDRNEKLMSSKTLTHEMQTRADQERWELYAITQNHSDKQWQYEPKPPSM